MTDSYKIYLDLMSDNEEAFSTEHFTEAVHCLFAGLHMAVELQDTQKLNEIVQRGNRQMEEVEKNLFTNFSWTELDNYTSLIQLAATQLAIVEKRLSVVNSPVPQLGNLTSQ